MSGNIPIRFRGVVGYHVCLTHRRSPVRARAKPLILNFRQSYLNVFHFCPECCYVYQPWHSFFFVCIETLVDLQPHAIPFFQFQFQSQRNSVFDSIPFLINHYLQSTELTPNHHHSYVKSNLLIQLELGKPERRRPVKQVNGIFWILLLNIGIFVADHLFQVQGVKALYLYHNWPTWYQFVTATFCHANWNHLSSNLFFLYIFGKLVEEEEGNFALWLSYILTGAGANLVSWLILPRNAVSVGASGAVFGLFAISVLVKMSWDWRKILEVLILGQFVIERVMEAAQASTSMSGSFRGSSALQNVNHIAHLSGALIGVALVWLLSRVPTDPPDPTSKTKDLQ